jgi:hypothetical protein
MPMGRAYRYSARANGRNGASFPQTRASSNCRPAGVASARFHPILAMNASYACHARLGCVSFIDLYRIAIY